MKVLGIVGSPRKQGNTYELIKYTLDKIGSGGFDTELVQLAGKKIQPCTACNTCKEIKKCSIDDDLWELFEKMLSADGILIGSPVYSGTAPGLLKSLLERTSWLTYTTGRTFERKIGAPIVVAARAGHNFTHAELLMWFHAKGFYMVGSNYWNIAFGWEKGDVINDKTAYRTLDNLVDNFIYLLEHLKEA